MKKAINAAYQASFEFSLVLRHRELRAAFAVSSHLTTKERVALHALSKGISEIAEIGSYLGASACCFGAACKKRGKGRVICIDTWQNDAMSEGARDTWAEFRKNTAPYKEFLVPIRGFSTDVVDKVREKASHLGLLFIDGDHSYDGVKADWGAYKSLLQPGSTVIFHDYGWAEGVRRVVHEDVMPLVDVHDSLPNMWWGTLCIARQSG